MNVHKDSEHKSLQPSRTSEISRRMVLKFLGLGAGMAAGVIPVPTFGQAPDAAHAPFETRIPSVKAPETLSRESKLFDALSPYFPELTPDNIHLIMPDYDWIDRSLEAFQFLLRELHPFYQESKQKLANANIAGSFFSESATAFELDFSYPYGGAYTDKHFNDTGIEKVNLTMHPASSEMFAAELLHLVENAPKLSEGRTVLPAESVSNVVHYMTAVWWVAYNENQISNGTPEKAVIPPLVGRDGQAIINPTVEEFNQLMIENIVDLHLMIQNGQSHLPRYENMDSLNTPVKYLPAIQLLDGYVGPYNGTDESNQYSVIEDLSGLMSHKMLSGVPTLQDTINIAPIAGVQGQSSDLSSYPQASQDVMNSLREADLSLDEWTWKSMVERYSRVNAENFALNPLSFVKKANDGTTDRLQLFACELIKYPDIDRMGFRELESRDKPVATLYTYVEHSPGNNAWYTVPLEVTPIGIGDDREYTFIYDMAVPKSIAIPNPDGGMLAKTISLQGLPLVIETKMESILGVPMTEGRIELTHTVGNFAGPDVAEVRPYEPPVATPSDEPGYEMKNSAVVEQPPAELPPEAKAIIEDVRARLQQLGSEQPHNKGQEITIFDSTAEVANSAEPQTQQEVDAWTAVRALIDKAVALMSGKQLSKN